MKIVDSLDEGVWRLFVNEHPDGNIFQTPEMFQVFSRTRGYQPTVEAVIGQNDQILSLLLPVNITMLNGIFHRYTTRSIAYGSVLFNPDQNGREALAFLLDNYSKKNVHKALFTELRNLTDYSSVQSIFQQKGYVYEEYLNYLIDIKCPPDQVLSNIGQRTRKHIRQGLRKGNVSVEQIHERSLLDTWYKLIQKTYQNAQVPLTDKSLFDAAFEILKPRGMIQFWLAQVDSTYVAASAELLYKNVIYGWYSGVDRAYSAELPGEMLMWHVLAWGSQNGYDIYDFGGAGKPNEVYGVRNFKAKFGGKLVCFGRNTFIHAPRLLRLSTAGYEIYRKFLR